MLLFAAAMLDGKAEDVERPTAGDSERGAFMEMRDRVAALRVRLADSSGEPGSVLPAAMPDAFEVFPFRYRDAGTGKWVRARYKATPDEIAARYAEW